MLNWTITYQPQSPRILIQQSSFSSFFSHQFRVLQQLMCFELIPNGYFLWCLMWDDINNMLFSTVINNNNKKEIRIIFLPSVFCTINFILRSFEWFVFDSLYSKSPSWGTIYLLYLSPKQTYFLWTFRIEWILYIGKDIVFL